MSRILITGTSGFIGRSLAEAMAKRHDVICLSRKKTPVKGVTAIQGDFTTNKCLARLGSYQVDVLIHLAAKTGGCDEYEGLRVNDLGTFRLLRYLIDKGCRKFVLASSIAAIGFQNVRFRPLRVPIPDEHPCLDRDGYGLSKWLMEGITEYLWRQNGALDFINIRLGSVIRDESVPTPVKAGPVHEWAIGSVSVIYLSDAVRCFSMAAEAARKPGARIMNAVAPQACVAYPVPVILRAWWGEDAEGLDMSHYERPGHEKDALFEIGRIREELGFVARVTPT